MHIAIDQTSLPAAEYWTIQDNGQTMAILMPSCTVAQASAARNAMERCRPATAREARPIDAGAEQATPPPLALLIDWANQDMHHSQQGSLWERTRDYLRSVGIELTREFVKHVL